LNPETGKNEPFDFERASWCGTGKHPPYDFLLRWAMTAPGKDTGAKAALVKELRPHGLDAVYEHYMAIWNDGTRGFCTAFDSTVFTSSPAATW
jgi:hypothetical protein